MTDRIFALVMILFVGGVLAAGQAMDHYSWPVIRMPLIMGIIAILVLIKVALKPTPPAEERAAEIEEGAPPGPELPDLRRDVKGMAQVVLAVPLLWGLGFVAGCGVYVAGIVKYHGHSWVLSLVLGAATAAVAYFVFYRVLHVPLPLGPLIGD